METMQRAQIVEKVKTAIAEVLRLDPALVTDESAFNRDLAMDSLDRVSLLMMLEDEFKGEIPDEEAKKFSTVADVVRFVETRFAGALGA